MAASAFSERMFEVEGDILQIDRGTSALYDMALLWCEAHQCLDVEPESILYFAKDLSERAKRVMDAYSPPHGERRDNDPAIDAVNALARALERHKELCDNWETRCEAGQERPKAIDDALHEWEDLQLILAQTPAKTMLGALAKADFLAMWAEDGDIAHHKALCRSISEDYARLRKEASHG